MHRTLALLVLLAGCSHAIQTTSGAAFIAQGPIDKDIAAIESNLRFPARIGVARIVNGALTLPSGDESAAFADMGRNPRPHGDFRAGRPLDLFHGQRWPL